MAAARLHVLQMPRLGEGETAPTGYSLTPCADCSAPCCASLRARLTTVEALRIARTLQVPLLDLVSRVPGADAHHPWFTVAIPVEDGFETLALKQTDAGHCTFLHHLGTRGRCSIHALRPGICRGYPYSVEQGGQRLQVGDQSLCGLAWMVDDAAEKRVRADFARWHRDLEMERQLVTRWSRRPRARRTWEGWVEFVGRALDGA